MNPQDAVSRNVPLSPLAVAMEVGADSVSGHVLQFLDLAQDAVVVFGGDGRIAYSNRAAKLLANALNPDKTPADLEFVGNWQTGLLTDHAFSTCLESGSWIGKVKLDGAGLHNRVGLIRLVALGPRNTPPFAMTIRDVTLESLRETELHERNAELEVAYAKLQAAQEQAFRTEKLVSIGQLAAGVAHEINNPIAYVKSNLNGLRLTVAHLLELARIPACEDDLRTTLRSDRGEGVEEIDSSTIAGDSRDLIMESLEGVDRVCKIVSDLKDFSHQDQIENWVTADMHVGLESTLNIVWNEIKYKAHVVKSYGELPLIECIPSQLNQVFMNLLINASQAIESNGIITITTECSDDHVVIMIGDNGKGIPPETVPRIFDPFFTTKTVGEGTGLGLAISYGIISKHHGTIEVTSVPGEGTLFMLKLPVAQPR